MKEETGSKIEKHRTAVFFWIDDDELAAVRAAARTDRNATAVQVMMRRGVEAARGMGMADGTAIDKTLTGKEAE